MAPISRAAKAFKAMKAIGILEESVKPVLKDLLDLYDKKWKLIEDENYRVLLDAIFDHEFPKVFMTPGRKWWGLRTLEDLPKGAFVCEYVGEIVTNTELYKRNMQSSRKNERHTYRVLLDADWGSEGVLKDEEALSLDATFYGNVARFINHRCYDANLVEIAVEVKTPDHHYYHLAFFTTRKVDAFEELTWDYGIDLEDQSHPIKAFRCKCESEFCRNLKRKKSWK